MSRIDIDKVHAKLTDRVREYVELIIKEYGSYIPLKYLDKLNNICDYSKILMIYDYGEVNAYFDGSNIVLPLCADKILDTVSKIPGYGINKNHKTYNDDSIIINNNTFVIYVKHIFISGSNAEDFFEDTLLHETMHFCGSGGSSIIKEGINELLTRMLAKKYNLRTSSCGYPKEVSLCYRLMEIFSEDVIKHLAFLNKKTDQIEYLKTTLGEDAANLYIKVSDEAEKEFQEKYYSHMNEFRGFKGIIKKIMTYRNIDYTSIYKIINDYCESHDIESKNVGSK